MTADATRPDAASVLRVGVISTVQSLNPLQAQDFVSAMVVAQIFDTPYARPMPDRDPQPLLFSEPLAADADGRVMSAPIRDGVRFSDGTAMTAAHVAGSLKKAAPFREHADVDADGARVVFRIKRPNARFDLVLTQAYASVVLEKGGKLLGTGAYVATPDATAERLRLVRNPHHVPAPKIEEVVFVCYPPEDGQPKALVAALERGEVDFSNVLQRKDVTQLQKVRKYFELGNSTAMLYFNTERPALQDVRVRRAIAHSIDRMELAAISHANTLAHTAGSILPPMMGRYKDGIRHDSAKAAALLEEADSPPQRLRLLLMFGPRPYLPHPQPTAEYIAAKLATLGIEVAIEQARDSEEYYQRVAQGDYDVALTGWIADTVDPADFLEAVLSEDAIPSPDRPISIHANLGRYRNPAVDEALERLRQDPSEATQQELLRLAGDELPVFPLMYGSIAFVHSWNVRNFTPPLLGIPDFSTLELSSF
ncbi:MAG: ABC transporter substrate-binding protein [Acidobacteriota bacterium]|nr:ABC transporter substrate-binding protein [Acidobacteriota bacterium]